MKSKSFFTKCLLLTTLFFAVLVQPVHKMQHFYNFVNEGHHLELADTTTASDADDIHKDNHNDGDDCSICDYIFSAYINISPLEIQTLQSNIQPRQSALIAAQWQANIVLNLKLRGPPQHLFT